MNVMLATRRREIANRQFVKRVRNSQKKRSLRAADIFIGLAAAILSLLFEHHDTLSASHNTNRAALRVSIPIGGFTGYASHFGYGPRRSFPQQLGRSNAVPSLRPGGPRACARPHTISDSSRALQPEISKEPSRLNRVKRTLPSREPRPCLSLPVMEIAAAWGASQIRAQPHSSPFSNSRPDLAHPSLFDTLFNIVSTLVPRVSIAPTAAIAMSEATNAYSIAFAPFWHRIIRINAIIDRPRLTERLRNSRFIKQVAVWPPAKCLLNLVNAVPARFWPDEQR